MCEEADYCYDVMRSTEHKARKGHICCACKEDIRVGDKYVDSFTLVSGEEPDRYKHCLRCWTILEAILKAREGEDVAIAWELNCGEDWKDTIGELPEEVAALAFMSSDEAQEKFGKLVNVR